MSITFSTTISEITGFGFTCVHDNGLTDHRIGSYDDVTALLQAEYARLRNRLPSPLQWIRSGAVTYCVRVCPASRYGYAVNDDKTPSRPRFMTIVQVADELAIGLPTVRMLLKSGELRGMQIGGRGMWRIATTDLENYIEQAYRQTAERITAGEVLDEDPVS